MYGAVIFVAGLLTGGIVGVVAMCLLQVTHCAECHHRKEHVNRDER